jgi:hypothetical protein
MTIRERIFVPSLLLAISSTVGTNPKITHPNISKKNTVIYNTDKLGNQKYNQAATIAIRLASPIATIAALIFKT